MRWFYFGGSSGFEGSEKSCGNLYYYGARYYDARTSIFQSVDRFTEKYSNLSPYSYAANNPLKYIDINGDSIYAFGPDGNYLATLDDGKERITGRYYQDSKEVKGGKTMYSNGVDFEFNDIAADKEAIKTGELKVRLVNEAEITSLMYASGAPGERDDAWSYIERESRPKGDESLLSGKSNGNMDYLNYTKYGYLNIVQSKQGNAAYNDFDYGNFLWGQGGNRLGFSYGTLRFFSHVNNAVNGRSDNPGVPHSILDSAGDQRAIKNGYHYNVSSPALDPQKRK